MKKTEFTLQLLFADGIMQMLDFVFQVYRNANANLVRAFYRRLFFLHKYAIYVAICRLAGHGKNHKDAASVRATHPIPAACGIYYFEVKIVSKGRDG